MRIKIKKIEKSHSLNEVGDGGATLFYCSDFQYHSERPSSKKF